jgi:formylglycine-generating enzyme required for sulfatase activity
VVERYGYSVWFDYQLIKGRDFGLQIGRKVREAKALVVLWCTRSVESNWVVEEAELARQLGILVPAKIESCTLPIGFLRLDYVNLSKWDGAPRSVSLDPLIKALEQKIGRSPAPDLMALWDYEETWRRFGAPPLRAFAFDQPPAADEGDRGLQGRRRPEVESPSISVQHSLLALAAQEWPAARDSGDRRRLWRFERQFAGTYYAEQARELREEIEAADRLAAGGRTEKVLLLQRGPGDCFRDFDAAAEMVVVPAGDFQMGSADDEGDDYEHPRHKVTIKSAFAVSISPVTRGEFEAFISATNHKIALGAYVSKRGAWKIDSNKSWRDPGFKQEDDHPMVCVNWHDAQAYAAWLREQSGKDYRLLSEAEWEYCCRAGTASVYSTGDDITAEQANFGLISEGTTPVSKFAPNAWGLRDLHGNVWEWCEDNWHPNYQGAPEDGSAWKGGDRSSRVLRGGSWDNGSHGLRSGLRNWEPPKYRSVSVGFRVAMTL